MQTMTEMADRMQAKFSYERDPQSITLALKDGRSRTFSPSKRLPYNELISQSLADLLPWARDISNRVI